MNILGYPRKVTFYKGLPHRDIYIRVFILTPRLQEPVDWIGKEIAPGEVGFINHGGLPKLLTKPGRYPGFPLRNWWAREWRGSQSSASSFRSSSTIPPLTCTFHPRLIVSDTVITFLGITIVQVSQNQAAVISDPNNSIFVVKNGGFVAFSAEGSYQVLAVVDQTHLTNEIKDNVTRATLGWSQDVLMKSNTGRGKSQDYVVALL